MRRFLLVTAACTLAAAAHAQTPSTDQQVLNRLEDMHSTGAPLDIATVPQDAKIIEQLRTNLKSVHLPPGFKIDVYAIVPDARAMAVGTNVGVVFVGTRKTHVYAVSDRTRARVADEVKLFAPSIRMRVPNGVCFSKDGFLYVIEQARVLEFAAAEFFYESPDTAVNVVTDQLIPKEEESYNHTARICRIGPDNKLYVDIGQPYNVPPPAKLDTYAKWGMGGIVRMDRDGKNREVFASGIRNSVGMDFNPKNGELWFTDNQVDGMGDDVPPGELDHATKAGENFGFPWYGGGHTRTVDYKDQTPPADVVFPDVETVAHAADLGMTFYNGKMFPDAYKGGIFIAEHGSWNRTEPVGARVMFAKLGADGKVESVKPFAEGWLTGDGEYFGRPVDVAVMLDGSLLVSDDSAGAIYRISYEK